YISFTTSDAPAGYMVKSRIGYLTSTNGGVSFTSYTNVLDFDQRWGNHKGGGVAFGKDGYLYVSFGDGGSSNDLDAYGQRTTTFYSKVLRIDVDNVPAGQTYGIPPDNPFKNGGGEPATYAYGFRNPFRFSFDRATGDLWLGDVGAGAYEEIDLVK